MKLSVGSGMPRLRLVTPGALVMPREPTAPRSTKSSITDRMMKIKASTLFSLAASR